MVFFGHGVFTLKMKPQDRLIYSNEIFKSYSNINNQQSKNVCFVQRKFLGLPTWTTHISKTLKVIKMSILWN